MSCRIFLCTNNKGVFFVYVNVCNREIFVDFVFFEKFFFLFFGQETLHFYIEAPGD